jgi:predicted enzyme related to lactoylglutathione lyase
MSETTGVGHIAWVDLTVQNAAETLDFYKQVIGWTNGEVAMEDNAEAYADYTMIDATGTVTAGICNARGGNLGLPPVWMLYLPVGDMAESLRRVEEEGGKVLKAVQGDDGNHAYAAIEDPVGVVFAIVPG